MSTPALRSAPEPPPEPTDPTPPEPPAQHLVSLDVLRGVALTGIVALNVPSLTHWTYAGAGRVRDLAPWLEELSRGRFISVFAFLFGVSFALVLAGAARRHPRPRVVVVRRLAFLLALGLLHHLVYPGEVLAGYALVGLLLVLPLSFAPWRWLPVALGALALAVQVPLHAEPGAASLGMVLLGYGAARLGLPVRLERPGRGVVVAALLLVPAAAVAAVLQQVVESPVVDGVSYAYTWADYAAAVAGAACLVAVVPLLLTTRLRRVLVAVFEPVGRMALTCYLGVTVVGLAARGLSEGATTATTGPDLALAAALVVGQVLASRWWLARHRHGPVEWAWRCATWWRVVPLRREGPRSGRS